jgi:hypothetical protein
LCCALAFWPNVASAFSGTFQGVLVPQANYDLAIPIVMEIHEAGGLYNGKVKTSSPMGDEGEITSGERSVESCLLTVRLSLGPRIRMEGRCTDKLFQGTYSLYSLDGEKRQGAFRLDLSEPEQKKKGPSDEDLRRQAQSVTACIKSNITCLALCPRGEYGTELVCANGCKRRLATCKTRAKKTRELPMAVD